MKYASLIPVDQGPAMPRKTHPADIRDGEVIAGAIRYDIALFLGVGQYARASAETYAKAEIEAERLRRETPNGRRPLIYAIDAAGRAALVQRAPKENPMQKTYAKKFNAQRAAIAAGHDPDRIEIIRLPEGYSWQPKAETKPEPAAPAPKPAKAKPGKPSNGQRAAIEAAARQGIIPTPPDFSAETHKRFRGKLAKLIAMAEAGDIAGLKAMEINPVSTSPKAMARYRDLAVLALEAKANG